MSLTISQAKQKGLDHSIDLIDVEVLLSFVLEKPRTFLFAWPEKELTQKQVEQFTAICKRRVDGEPVAYIVGEREFWSLPLLVEPSTLIPRPDTEILVETVLNHTSDEPLVCVDLGAGTGAIALALKSERPAWTVSGVDRVDEAVMLATKNAERLHLDVDFFLASWCDSLADNSIDVIVTNPPYIDEDDEHLSQGDVRFEPHSALVAAKQGYSDIEEIAQQSLACLKPEGLLFIEHGWQQASRVREILSATGYVSINTVADYGGNERVTFGRLPR